MTAQPQGLSPPDTREPRDLRAVLLSSEMPASALDGQTRTGTPEPLGVDSVLRGLGEDDLQALLRGASVVTCSRGQVLYREGDAGDALILLTQGRLKALRRLRDQPRVVRVLASGDTVGETAVFDQPVRTETVVAMTAATCLSIPRGQIFATMRVCPELYLAVLRNLSRQVDSMIVQAEHHQLSDVPSRLAGFLVGLGRRLGEPCTDGLLVAHGLSQRELAEIVLSSREAVNKTLRRFSTDGWVSLQGTRIVLHDLARLEGMAESYRSSARTQVASRSISHNGSTRHAAGTA